jgi:TPR repeat protein
MKANRLRWALLLSLVGAGFQLPAQQSEADAKLLADIRAKAEEGDAQSQFELAKVLDSGGLGVAKDEAEAVKWLRKAAEQDYANAQCNLGCCYYNGQGVAKDYVAAFRWFREAAGQHVAAAQFNLGLCYFNDRGVAKNEVEAVKWCRRAAEQNFVQAQNDLGLCYARGQGVAKDAVEAVKWYRRAAEQNLVQAQNNLGLCYAKGQGVAKGYAEAVKWYRKAAEQNCAEAQNSLGLCYAKGQGVAKDYAETVKWYRKAAEQNCAEAQYGLGYCCYDGQGVPRDYVEAVKWFRKAAEQNCAEAQDALGYCCYNGQGVAKDELEAVKWYRKAAEQGYAKAQDALGLCCVKGRGVAKDYVEACKWLVLAAGQGDEGAKKNAAMLQKMMPGEQIAEGQKLARNFKPHEVPPAGGDSPAEDVARTRPESSGTGFFITEDGYLIANEHLAGNGAQARVVTGAGIIPARVVKVDVANDLALLKAEGAFAALPVGSSRAVKAGSTVATVGFPNVGLQGFAPRLAKGSIAALSGAQGDPKYFQINVPVQPGNSGGALVDGQGNVIGVLSAKLNGAAALATSGALPENANFALKSNLLLNFLESVPGLSAKLKEPSSQERQFEDVVKSAGKGAVLVLVY